MNQVVDIFASIVSNVSTALGVPVHFRHGHKVEIDNLITALNGKVQDSSIVWPVVWMMHDFPQNETVFLTNVKVSLFILTRTSPTYTAEQRKELVFKPVLVPIYNELKKQIIRSRYNATTEADIKWPRIDHYFYGSEQVMKQENVFSVWTDCIELDGLELALQLPECDDVQLQAPILLYAETDVQGRYMFIKHNKSMADPSFHAGDYMLKTNGFPLQEANTITFNYNDDLVFILDFDGADIHVGDLLTLDIAAGNIKSADGYPLGLITGHAVTNNTQ